MTITQITRTALRETIRPTLEETLVKAFKKYGLTVEVGNIRFSSDNAHCKVSVKTKENAAQSAKWGGFKTGQIVNIAGEKCKIVGFRPNARKYPIIYQKLSNPLKRYVCHEYNVTA